MLSMENYFAYIYRYFWIPKNLTVLQQTFLGSSISYCMYLKFLHESPTPAWKNFSFCIASRQDKLKEAVRFGNPIINLEEWSLVQRVKTFYHFGQYITLYKKSWVSIQVKLNYFKKLLQFLFISKYIETLLSQSDSPYKNYVSLIKAIISTWTLALMSKNQTICQNFFHISRVHQIMLFLNLHWDYFCICPKYLCRKCLRR